MVAQGHQGHFKRSLEFVWIGILILKVSDVDFDLFFFLVHSKFFPIMFRLDLVLPTFSSKVREC